MDTGSSDLWVLPGSAKVELTNTTKIQIQETYGSGAASGSIQFAELEFGGFKVPHQGEQCRITSAEWYLSMRSFSIFACRHGKCGS